jgi:hypothetical protein
METTFSGDKNTPKDYIVFFDLDLTITKSISGEALARGACRKGLMTHWNLLKAIFLSFEFRLKLKDPLKIMDDMVSWVNDIPEKSVIELCLEVFHEILLPSVYKEAISEIE